MRITPELDLAVQDLQDLVDTRPVVKDSDKSILEKAKTFLRIVSGKTQMNFGALMFLTDKANKMIKEIESIRT